MLDFLLKFPELLHPAIVFGPVIMLGALAEILPAVEEFNRKLKEGT